jgi:peptidoglycan/LPS O-acetylase OafA/YrhL
LAKQEAYTAFRLASQWRRSEHGDGQGVISRVSTQDAAGTIRGAAEREVPGRQKARAPGFDGLRALAVLAVIAFHEQITAAPGGFLGVDVFFVLSGYLITDLLVAHRERHGRLDLRGFWVRRARRLLPALAVVLVTVTAAAAVLEPDQLGQLRPALLAAVTYSSNWWQALYHQSYFATFGPPPLLRHLWSLAIEEQFYLAWPLILAVVLAVSRRKRVRAAVAWLGAAASALLMAVIYVPGADPSRVYYGTDTHATSLLIGAALALTWPLKQVMDASKEKTQRLDLAGVIGIAVLAWAMGHFVDSDAALYPVGLVVAALSTGGVVVAAAGQGAVGRMLSWQPLRWLGVRSYGIYLWHWPVIALAVAVAGPGPQNALMRIIETAAAILLAAASWRWIEAPILRGGFRATFRARCQTLTESLAAARRSPLRALPALAVVAALTVACTAGYQVLRAPTSTGMQQQIMNGARFSETTHARSAGGAGSSRASAAAPTGGAAAGGVIAPPVGGDARGPVPGSRVTAIGDSVMLAAAPELAAALRGVYIDAQVSRQMSAGLLAVRHLADQGLLRPVVVVGLGTNGTVTSAQIRELLAEVGSRRELVLVNTFVPRPWEEKDNAVLAAAAGKHANVVLADWRQAIESRTGLLWADRVHPRPPGARLYARVVAAAVQATQNRRIAAARLAAEPSRTPAPALTTEPAQPVPASQPVPTAQPGPAAQPAARGGG